MTDSRPLPGPSPDLFARRRAALLPRLERSVMILPAGGLTTYAHDCDNRYRPDGDFRYLTGFPEPDSILVLRPDAEHPFTLFVPPRDPQQEVWTGRRHGPEGACARHGADAAFPLELFVERLPALLDGCETLYYAIWRHPTLDTSIAAALRALRSKERFGRRAPQRIVEPGALLHESRLIKGPEELALLETACAISAEAHRAAMGATRPGVGEWQVQAEIESVFRRRGGVGPGFSTIVGSGANGCVLHYIENEALIADGALVLVDAGCEYGGYNGDITRTFPASGRFSAPQAALYDVVHAALEAVIAAARPGTTIDALHQIALRILSQGLIDLKILSAPLDEILERELFKPYYMHRTSHWLGIDVHDLGAYRVDGAARPLQPGMVFTVEPGLYLQPEDTTVPPELRGQAVRIEDDVVITDSGVRNLTRGVPVEREAVAALVGS